MLPSELNKYQEFGFKKIIFRPVSIFVIVNILVYFKIF
jgi:hypothetical protein